MSYTSSTCESSAGTNTKTDAQTLLSVIIPALNEEKMIGRCLDALLQANVGLDITEIIIVDNGSVDDTCRLALEYASSLNIKILKRRNASISAVRNYGAAVARGAFLAFLDADCVVPRDWMKFGVELLSDGAVGVIGAHCRIPPNSSWVAKSWSDGGLANHHSETSYIPTGDMFVPRETFQILGGFDESLETNEDYEFCQRAKAAGFPVRAYPQLEVIHLGTPQSLSAFYRQSRWHGRHVFRVFLRSLPSFRNARPVLYAVYVLAAIASVLLGAGSFFISGKGSLFFAALGLMLAGPFALAVHKARRRREWHLIAPLFVLFLTYGIARAMCLVPLSGRVRSKGHRRSKAE